MIRPDASSLWWSETSRKDLEETQGRVIRGKVFGCF
jgi:hypothetical protein